MRVSCRSGSSYTDCCTGRAVHMAGRESITDRTPLRIAGKCLRQNQQRCSCRSKRARVEHAGKGRNRADIAEREARHSGWPLIILPLINSKSIILSFPHFGISYRFIHSIELTIFSFPRMNRFAFTNYQSMNMVHRTKEGNELWLGDYYAASNVSLLKQKNIRAVLTSAAMLGINYQKEHSITHKTINAFDIPSYKMTPHFEEAFKFIDEALKQGNILVHCAAGISRSTTFVLVFLMRGENMSFKQALDYVRVKRSIICPNYGFQNQLKRFEVTLKRAKSEKEPEKPRFDHLTEKKVVLDFLNEDKKTAKKEEKMSSTFAAGGSKFINPLLTSSGMGGTLNDSSFLRGKSVNYAPRRNLENGPERGVSKMTKQYLSFKLETPKIVTIKK